MPLIPDSAPLFIGLMSGTSMDGIDAVLTSIRSDSTSKTEAGGIPTAESIQVLAHASLPMPDELRHTLMALNQSGPDELHRAALAANALVRLYAQGCHEVMKMSGVQPAHVQAIGAHGQTVRHRPGIQCGLSGDTGYTLQINNPALLAELTGVDVVADFRSRDVAAGGQGAPLVPAFHQRLFSHPEQDVAVLNLGGIANLTLLPAGSGTRPDAVISGFDSGPANALMDYWIQKHQQQPLDRNGAWAATGTVHPELLAAMLREPYFQSPPPKSTGRDLFHPGWLQPFLDRFSDLPAQDVQATLLALTVRTAAQDLSRHLPHCQELLVCGGGALNSYLMQQLAQAVTQQGLHARVISTAERGLPPTQVEAAAFAWLASRTINRLPGNLPSATGAAGSRILGAIYPAQ